MWETQCHKPTIWGMLDTTPKMVMTWGWFKHIIDSWLYIPLYIPITRLDEVTTMGFMDHDDHENSDQY